MRAALLTQAPVCGGLGSPFMERLLTVLAEVWDDGSPLGQFCAGFDGDIGASGHSLPLRLAGGLHHLVLTGASPDLADVYPPSAVPRADLSRTLAKVLADETHFLKDWMLSPPQTNEVRRSAVLIAAAHWLSSRYPLPLTLSELGASGGLNLGFDRFGLEAPSGRLGPADPVLTLTPDWQGEMPAPTDLLVSDRRGVDLHPIDVKDPAAQLRLLSYLWPDQPQRADRTRAAIAAHSAAVDAGDAVDWLENRLNRRGNGLHLIYHTVAWQYFPATRQTHGTGLIEDAGARATADAPLAWLRFEADGNGPGAGISLRLWPEYQSFNLGRADFHGRWVQWDPQQEI